MAEERLFESMMRLALRRARKGAGKTSPNPMVGAVIFKGDRIIATGHHLRAGRPHAEIVALRKAGSEARGASLAVNLEPCCHFGRTPPCTEMIIKAGIREVIYATKDPDVRVCGRGGKHLEENGIRVIPGVLGNEARRLNEVYLTWIKTGRPFVVLKMAQSLDGRIATVGGESRWISGIEALRFAHKLRARYDAVAVGGGTVRSDNPRLTVRHVGAGNPLRVIVTDSADLSPKLNVFKANKDYNTIVATSRKTIASGAYNAVITWPVRKKKGRLDLVDLLDQAARKGVTSILFEGGQRLATSLLRHHLVDKYFLIIAPMVLGQGVEAIDDLGIRKVTQAIRFRESGFKKIGTDILFWGYPKR